MRSVGILSPYAGAALAMAASQIDVVNYISVIEPTADFSQPKRRRTGRTYPHSSKRQNDRIARQLAAGQIQFIQHGPRA